MNERCIPEPTVLERWPHYFLVVDLEATCDDQRRIPSKQMEIIEIGAVLVRARDLTTEAEFQTFVRPVVHPVLLPFCTQLTSITQDDVDAAPTFPEAIEALRRFIGERDALFCSWGDYDRKQFELDASRHRVELPFRGGHLNLKPVFAQRLGTTKKDGMAGALRRVGLPLVGTHHRGIDDARNIARLLPHVFGVERSRA